MTETALCATDLSVGYQVRRKRRLVLSGLNLEVHAGELVCLLGPNGVGKSTLLRTIAKIQPSLGGEIQVCGLDIRKLTQIELARKIGIVLTERVAVGALSGREIVELGRYPHVPWTGRLAPRDHDVVQRAMAVVGALHLADRDSNKLSDGERQKLMIARAMAQEPAILILDEPTAFLDIASRVEMMGVLRGLARQESLAVVISTHDLELALRMADTLWLVMAGGRLHSGIPEDVIFAGHIEATFRAESICFRPEERAFRPIGGTRGKAIVKGEGLGAGLARAVLEREGYVISETDPARLTVTVEPGASRWKATAGAESHTGNEFAALARLARRL